MSRGAGGSDVPWNIIWVGASCTFHKCHRKIEALGREGMERCWVIIARREKTMASAIVDATYALRRLPKYPMDADVKRELSQISKAAGKLVKNALRRKEKCASK